MQKRIVKNPGIPGLQKWDIFLDLTHIQRGSRDGRIEGQWQRLIEWPLAVCLSLFICFFIHKKVKIELMKVSSFIKKKKTEGYI